MSRNKKTKVALVTGGAGFIGSHIVDGLIKKHIKVFVVDDLASGKRSNVNPNARFIKMSVLSPKFPALVKKIKPEFIFHLAAQIDLRLSVHKPAYDAKINIMGTLAMIEAAAAAGTKKIIFSSTGGPMYSSDRRPPYSESLPAEPISPYGIAKRTAEMYLAYARDVHGIDFVALRYANVYGPRQDSSKESGVVAIFTRAMMQGKQPVIFGDGKATRDYVYVGDVVRANMLAMNKKPTGIFNIGTGRQTSVNQVFDKLKKITGATILKKYGPAQPGEVLRSALSSKLAKKNLKWEPKIKFDEGLRKTVSWTQKKK